MRERALHLRLDAVGDGPIADNCEHMWGQWQLQSAWPATAERAEERAWHRSCAICRSDEYLRQEGTTVPPEDAKGWLFQP